MTQKNILFVVADTLSAFHLPLYGYNRDTAPFLTSLAEDNWYAVSAYANAPFTFPSHASIFTGQLPVNHRGTSESMYLTNAALTDELQTQGYTTQAITNNRAIRPELGFDGWDRHRIVRDHERFARPGLRRFSEMMPEGGYDSVERAFLTAVVETRDPLSLLAGIRMKLSNPPASATRYPDSGARRTNELVESWVAETEEPFFMYLNYLEPHLPYDPPDEYLNLYTDDPDRTRRQLGKDYDDGAHFRWQPITQEQEQAARDLYDASIRYLDDRLRELYEKVRADYPNTIIIFLGDHGELISEGPIHGHMCGIWEKLLRVPLIVAGPDADGVEKSNVALRDLFDYLTGDTVLDDLGKDRVYAEYFSLLAMLDVLDRRNWIEDHMEDGGSYLRNRAKAVIDGQDGLVLQSHLDNRAFVADMRENSTDRESPNPERQQELRSMLYDQYDLVEWCPLTF